VALSKNLLLGQSVFGVHAADDQSGDACLGETQPGLSVDETRPE